MASKKVVILALVVAVHAEQQSVENYMAEQIEEQLGALASEGSQNQLGVSTFARSEEKSKLDAEIKEILQENQKADLQIQTLLDGTVEQQADERQQQKIDAQAQSEGMAEEKLDMYMAQGLNNKNGLNAKTAEKLDAYIQTKWGFIRNIININTFFSNATSADASTGSKSLLDDEKPAKKDTADQVGEGLSGVEKDLEGEFEKSDDDKEEQAAAPKKKRTKRVKHYKVKKGNKEVVLQPQTYEAESTKDMSQQQDTSKDTDSKQSPQQQEMKRTAARPAPVSAKMPEPVEELVTPKQETDQQRAAPQPPKMPQSLEQKPPAAARKEIQSLIVQAQLPNPVEQKEKQIEAQIQTDAQESSAIEKQIEELKKKQSEIKERAMKSEAEQLKLSVEKKEQVLNSTIQNQTALAEQAADAASEKFRHKRMDPDDSFRAVELIVPDEEILKDKQLQKQIEAPQWESYVYVIENANKSAECQRKRYNTLSEAQAEFVKDQHNPQYTKVLVDAGNIVQTQGEDQMKLSQCMGQAVLSGNLKRKAFAKGYFYVVNQTDLGNQTYNILERFKSQEQAKKKFADLKADKYAKIVVDGASGRIIDKRGRDSLVAQNLMYMYEHVQGKVYNGRFAL